MENKLESLTSSDRIKSSVFKRFGRKIDFPSDTPNLSALASMNERSVCRDYKTDPIEDSVVEMLCATAFSAPSKSDLQQTSIIRVQAKSQREAIHNLLPNSSWISKAPEFLVFCGDHSRIQKMFEVRGEFFPNNHLDTFFNAAVDAGVLLSTFVQAANLAGLGTCPISEIRDHCEKFSSILALPKWVFPVVGLTLGKAASFEPLSPRLGLESTLHLDRYDSSEMEAKISNYDSRRNESRPYNSQRKSGQFGKVDNYGWSEDKFRQYSELQRVDFGDYVRGQGFEVKK